MAVKESIVSGNGNGITAQAGSFIRISGLQAFNNSKGLNPAGGTINSHGNNEVDGNTLDGTSSGIIPKK